MQSKHRPKVSVIIPAYNVQAYITECINSLKAQTFNDFEAIVINDGSTDNTLALISEAVADDSRFVVYDQTNKGLASTRNRGLGLAQGDFVYFFDSDDLIEPEMLESTVHLALDDELDLVHFNALPFNDRDYAVCRFTGNNYLRSVSPDHGNFYQYLMQSKQYRSPVWLYLIRRSLLEDNKIRFIEGIIHEDEAFTLQVMNLSLRHGFIERSFFKRRMRSNSIMTSGHSMKNVRGYFETFRHLAEWFSKSPDIDPGAKETVRKHIGMFYLNALRIALELGELKSFRRSAIKHSHHVLRHVPPKNSVAVFFPQSVASRLAY
ncbi:MAG: glycosyltransferase [Marinobacter sp.]|uniref:glycosyltransferase n=1 Tax=Marinobacter sp. TaxID=50741 RepID=UPI00299D687D|nr:glycosyltransferase [Marinobacter sp.]MDX1634514.1 glycosyltransferase [Marinobacter sp.]